MWILTILLNSDRILFVSSTPRYVLVEKRLFSVSWTSVVLLCYSSKTMAEKFEFINRADDYVHGNRYTCAECDESTTLVPELHKLIRHKTKTAYYRCPGCEHVDVVSQSFAAHINTHAYQTESLERCWEVNLPSVTKFYECSFWPCMFQTGTVVHLEDHLASVHNQRPSGYHPNRCAAPLRPISSFPPGLASIAQDQGACLIGKLYGESTAVIVMKTLVPLGTYAVRSQIGDRLGFARLRRHPGNPAYDTVHDAGSDEKELPRSKADLFNTTKKPWTVPCSISFTTRLEDGKTYLLAEPFPTSKHYIIKVLPHNFH